MTCAVPLDVARSPRRGRRRASPRGSRRDTRPPSRPWSPVRRAGSIRAVAASPRISQRGVEHHHHEIAVQGSRRGRRAVSRRRRRSTCGAAWRCARSPLPWYAARYARHRRGWTPSRWAKTGTRASAPGPRSTRLRPPRGTMTSTAPSRPLSISPTAARSRTGTQRDRRLGQARRAQALDEAGMDQAGRVEALGAPAQDRRVAGLEADVRRRRLSPPAGSRR